MDRQTKFVASENTQRFRGLYSDHRRLNRDSCRGIDFRCDIKVSNCHFDVLDSITDCFSPQDELCVLVKSLPVTPSVKSGAAEVAGSIKGFTLVRLHFSPRLCQKQRLNVPIYLYML